MILINHNAIIEIPSNIAICPYCGDSMVCQIIEWTYNDDGTVSANQIEVECGNEHDYPMPYVYWHPVVDKIKSWLNEHYDFDMTDWQKKLKQWEGKL